jgi:catechol 2,3-dioxygenase-like lactoylglutathione lyase family enzyme
VLHHLTLWVPDLGRSEPAWRWLLEELGYTVDRSLDRVLVFRHPGGLAVALEESPDMVPGMLYSRLRPGVNHIAFTVDSASVFDEVVAKAADHGWLPFSGDRHPISSGARVAYLEDADGFEVELVAPAGGSGQWSP